MEDEEDIVLKKPRRGGRNQELFASYLPGMDVYESVRSESSKSIN